MEAQSNLDILPEIAAVIFSHMSDTNLAVIHSDPKMRNLIKQVYSNSRFWKSRTEGLLGYSTSISLNDWKSVYTFLNTEKSLDDSFQEAASNGHTEVVKLLLADPRGKTLASQPQPDPSASNNFAIREAASNGHTEVVKLLLADPRVDPSVRGNFAIQWAAMNGHTEVVKLLLADPRVDSSVNTNFAIREAASNGHTEVVKLLLADPRGTTLASQPQPDPSASNNFAIREAASNGHTEVVKLLLADPRVDPSVRGNFAIQWAAMNGHTEVVKLLLAHPKITLQTKQLYGEIISEHVHSSIKQLLKLIDTDLLLRQQILTKFFWWCRLEIYYKVSSVEIMSMDVNSDPLLLYVAIESTRD